MPLRRNAVAPLRLSLVGADDQPIDLNGASFKLDVRLYPGAEGPPLFSVSSGSGGITIVDAVGGVIEIDWPMVSAAIEALPSSAEAGDPSAPRIDTFCYDLLLISAGGQAQAIVEGPVPVSFGVTRNG